MRATLDLLRAEVLGRDVCTACGACVGLCPHIVALDDHVAAVGSCRVENGRCFAFCPRTEAPAGAGLGGDAGFAGPMGHVLASYLGRARPDGPEPGVAAAPASVSGATRAEADARPVQHGGVVSALMKTALDGGMVETALLTSAEEGGAPRATVARTAVDVVACRGSKFAAYPVVAGAHRPAADSGGRVGVVALPCQATALAKMRMLGQGVELVVGLFCTWALDHDGWAIIRKKLGPEPYARIDIPPPPAEVLRAEDEYGTKGEVPLSEVRCHVRPACRVCLDMTAENADVSVGMAEADPGWNTVLVRTNVGRALVERATASGALELRPLPEAAAAGLQRASLAKKRRAATEAAVQARDEGRREPPSPHLRRVAAVNEMLS